MKEVYLLRHGEKDATGSLTERGKEAAKAMGSLLPHFAVVFSSDSERAALTARLISGQEPHTDWRAGFAMAPADVSDTINTLSRDKGISFLDAARLHNDATVLDGIDEQAHALNAMIDEILEELGENEKALVVSHDLTIAPAMGFRGMPAESIEPLGGYVISSDDVPVRRYE